LARQDLPQPQFCPRCGNSLDQNAGNRQSSRRTWIVVLFVAANFLAVAVVIGIWRPWKDDHSSAGVSGKHRPSQANQNKEANDPDKPTPHREAPLPFGEIVNGQAGKLDVPVLYLEYPPQPTGKEPDWMPLGILLRELHRQALLIAARDGLGLTTRDAVLGELAPEGLPVTNRFNFISQTNIGSHVHLDLARGPE
jgi:hypothetical protein